MNYEEINKNLLTDFMNYSTFSSAQKRMLNKVNELYCNSNNLDFLYNVYDQCFEDENKKIFIVDHHTGIGIRSDKDDFVITYKELSSRFTKELFIQILPQFICIVGKILPLGTVVNLKKDLLNNLIDGKNIENVQIIIIDRFLNVKDSQSYFEYTGVVYPLGHAGIDKELYFTPRLIESVVFEGYSDDKDLSYIYLAKNELILNNKMYSYGLAEKDAQEKMLEIMRGDNKND